MQKKHLINVEKIKKNKTPCCTTKKNGLAWWSLGHSFISLGGFFADSGSRVGCPRRKTPGVFRQQTSAANVFFSESMSIYKWVFPKIRGTPKSSILIGFSIINHPFWGTVPLFWKHPFFKRSLVGSIWWIETQ